MTPGQKCVEAIRAYLAQNKTVWRKLNGEIVVGIIDKALESEHKRTVPRPTQDWLEQLRNDPANEGLDVDKELNKAQLWCNQNRRLCTQRFFVNWLMKAERVIGPGQFAINALPELQGWRYFLEERKAEGMFEAAIPQTWEELQKETRQLIHGQKFRLRSMHEFATNTPAAWREHLETLRRQSHE